MRFFIVFAAIALCVNARTLKRNSRQAPYPSEGPITQYEGSHVPFATYGLPQQQIFSIIPSVQHETLVAPSLPASIPLSDIPSPIVFQTPAFVPQQQAFVNVPSAPEPLPLPQIPAHVYNVQPIQLDVSQQLEVPHIPADSYGPPPRIEASTQQLVIPPAPQPFPLPEFSIQIFSEPQREAFAAYGIPTLHEEPKVEEHIIPAAICGPPIVSTETPKIEASTQLLVIPPAPEALPLPELPIPVFKKPAREPFAANGIPTLREEPITEAPTIPAATYRPAIVSTEAPKIEASTQPLVIPPAPEALPLPELPIPVFEEPPKQPFAAYGAPLFHEEPKTEAPIIPAAVYEAPIVLTEAQRIKVPAQQLLPAPQPEQPAAIYEAPIFESGPYPAQGPVSHYGDPVVSSSIVLNEPIVESSPAVLGGPYPAQGPVSHYGDSIASSSIVLNEPIVESSPGVFCGPYPAQGPVSHYGDPIVSSSIVLNEPTVESSPAVLGGPYSAQGPVSHYGDQIVRLL